MKHPKSIFCSSRFCKDVYDNHACEYQQFSRYCYSAVGAKNFKKNYKIVVAVALIFFVSVGLIINACLHSCERTYLSSGQVVKLTISDNISSTEVANLLYKAGLIDNKSEFLDIVEANNIMLKAGDYIFTKGETPIEIAEQIGKGSNYSTGLVVAKGDRISTIASKVEKYTNGRISADEFNKACSDARRYSKNYSFLVNSGANSVEGFLFPKTYEFDENYTAESLVIEMLDAFKKNVEENIINKVMNPTLDDFDIVTLASIVEKESDDAARTKVASVFLNRLKINMPLQSDATTVYEFGHIPSPEEVHADTPYSTYTNYGLPPTPICSPSIDSINAVCFPEKTDYLYFYFKNEHGKTKCFFSKTYEEHNAAIAGERD